MPKYTKDYYKILNASLSSTEEEIQEAYNKTLAEYVSKEVSATEEDFSDLDAALEILTNPNTRYEYDEWYKKILPHTKNEITTSKHCIYCNAALQLTDAFCPSCGKKQERKSPLQWVRHIASILILPILHTLLSLGATLIYVIIKNIIELISPKTLFFIVLIIEMAPITLFILALGLFANILFAVSEKLYVSKNGMRYKVFAFYYFIISLIVIIDNILLLHKLPVFSTVYTFALSIAMYIKYREEYKEFVKH